MRSQIWTLLGENLFERRGVFGRSFGMLIDAFFVLLLAFICSRIAWTIASPASFIPAQSSDFIAYSRAAGPRLIADVRVFERFDPFNRNLTVTDAPVEAEEAPETSLNLEIKSLFASTDEAQSAVRLLLPNNNVERFKVGDNVVNGVVLDRILSDRIILSRAGQKEVLFEREKRVISEVLADGTPVIDPTPRTQIVSTETQTASPSQPQIQNLKLDGIEDVYAALQIRRRVMENGKQGLVIGASANRDVLSELGLQAGDQLYSLNGYNLAEEPIGETFEALSDQKRFELRIIRNGAALTRSIELENGVGVSDD